MLTQTQTATKTAQDTLKFQRKSDSINAEYQRIKDSASKENQRIKDSTSFAKTDSALKLTRQSIKQTKDGLRITEKSMFLTTEISRTAIQPFVFVDTIHNINNVDIQNLRVDGAPSVDFRIINVGSDLPPKK